MRPVFFFLNLVDFFRWGMDFLLDSFSICVDFSLGDVNWLDNVGQGLLYRS